MDFFYVVIPFLAIISQQIFVHATSYDFIVRIWLRAKQNFHPIWIMTEKSLGGRHFITLISAQYLQCTLGGLPAAW